MNASELSLKAAVSVSQMCEMCSISRSRWYEMVASGVFPKPVQLPSMKRPVYDRSLQEKCLEIRATGIGLNGVPVVFNRKPKKGGQSKAQRKPVVQAQADHADLLHDLKALGLTTTAQAVGEAVATLYPNGLAGFDPDEVATKVFRHLFDRKK